MPHLPIHVLLLEFLPEERVCKVIVRFCTACGPTRGLDNGRIGVQFRVPSTLRTYSVSGVVTCGAMLYVDVETNIRKVRSNE